MPAPVHAGSRDVHAALAERLDSRRLQRDVPLAPYTTFRIGGPADFFYTATSNEDLAHAVISARAIGVPYFLLGLGANILVGDLGFRGLVIRNVAEHFAFRDDGRLIAESGATIGRLIQEAIARGWSGLEHYVGIPSTVGGAVWQNLHFLSPAPDRERTMFIEEVVESCELLTAENERKTVDRSYMQFGYDTSILHSRADVALEVTFRLQPGDTQAMHRIAQENLSWRGARHPWLDLYPSAGSIFRKIEGMGAGRLIDQCGLKGFQIGGAEFSPMHANIIVNLGAATAADVRALIRTAQDTVQERFKVRLEPEIGFIGEF